MSAPRGPFGKLFVSLFFLVFLAFGVFFTGLILRGALHNIATWSWRETACTILSSEVSELNPKGRKTGDFHVRVRFEYTFATEAFTGEDLSPQSRSFSDYSKADRLAQRFPAGDKTVCFVNPSKPSEAVLQKGGGWLLLLVLFPLIFVAIGAGGIYFTWRGVSRTDEVLAVKPISDRNSKKLGRRGLALFFGLFPLVGSVCLYFFFVRPVLKIVEAKNWPGVPCVVISSEVRSHDSDDGTTYSVNILYSYEFNRVEHKFNCYGFMSGSSSGYSGKAAIVRQYPPGRKALCYVNPRDPTEAVLQRGFTPTMWFGLIPLLFVLVGAFGLVHALRKPDKQSALRPGRGPRPTGFSPDPPTAGMAAGTMVLKPKTAPWMKVVGSLFVAAFWNGIVSVFLMEVIKGWRSGRADWFQTIFLVPFVLIGVFLVFLVIYFLLALFNPRPRLKVTPGAVRLGEPLKVEWDIKGRTNVLERLTIRLEGREEATCRRGTNSYTDKNVFAALEVTNVTARSEMRSGVASVELPHDLMHSFASDNNKIIWTLRLEGSIARWPDVDEAFDITVLPVTTKMRST